MSLRSSQKKAFKPFASLRSWWKRRRFQHLQEAETHEESEKEKIDVEIEPEMTEEIVKDNGVPSTPLGTPLALYFNAQPPRTRDSYPFQRSNTADSFQNSIESMDSVIDSHWDPDDEETSQATVRHGNGEAYLLEHLNFLSVSTQPQEVELMHGN